MELGMGTEISAGGGPVSLSHSSPTFLGGPLSNASLYYTAHVKPEVVVDDRYTPGKPETHFLVRE
jgi:hypothetical protein